MKKILLLLLLPFLALAQHEKEKPYVILVSFDGFRYDYVATHHLANFERLIAAGAKAELIPSFPSKTFPNHYTIVTGLYPGHHGLVDNHFYDPIMKVKYTMKDPKAVVNPAFYGGTPLWQLAQQQGMKTASFFWVGSEAPVQGELPTYAVPFDDHFSDSKRIDQVVEWLKLPDAQRPHFISLYFSLVDHAGHDFGPDTEGLHKAVVKADSLLGQLMSDVNTLHLPVNIILVSDHGMLNMKSGPETFITLSEIFSTKDPSVTFSNGGTQVQLYTTKIDSMYALLKSFESRHFKVYRKKDRPAAWHYDSPRTGDLLMVAEPGYYFEVRRAQKKDDDWYPAFGTHGFDPGVVKEMRGIFYAYGPNVRAGVTVPPFENIHIYPFIAKILGLKTPEVDGDDRLVKKIYKK